MTSTAEPVGDRTLLATKLHLPRRRHDAVRRERLTDRLAAANDASVTLVSAPAGFGKTSLLADWLGDVDDTAASAAWLALDDADNDPTLFWTYVIAAIRRVSNDVGEVPLALLHSAQPLTSVVGALVNDLHAHPGRVVLVLDDYHVIHSTEIHESIGYLIEHMPPSLHLVIASRTDPPIALARLRARRQLVEVRAGDLRFTHDESSAYLNGTMGLRLTGGAVDALGARTEGWIAALQLAALSLQGRADVDGFIANFTGDDRFVVDYLAEEVLDRQPPDVRAFLLQTAILHRLSGSVCDAVTGTTGGRAMLEQLDRSNLFLVALDDRRHWYRYHHLFADVLRARLLDEDPALVDELHRRASRWYADNDEPAAAVEHALAGRHFDDAARLIELAAPALRRRRQEGTLRRWLEALPDETFADRPVLAIALVGARMATGDVAGVEALLEAIDAALARPADSSTVFDAEMFRALPAQVAVQRAGLRLLGGDIDGTITHASRALKLIDVADHLRRGAATALLALARWTAGDLGAAVASYTEAIEHLIAADHLPDMLGCSLALADIQIAQGKLTDAQRTFETGLRWTVEHPGLRGAADMHVGLSEVLIERNQLADAAHHLAISHELGESAGLPQHAYRWRVVMARLCRANGDHERALALIDEAAPRYDTDFSPPVRPVAAIRARVQLGNGDLEQARTWAHRSGLTPTDDPTYIREYEHITLARVLIAAAQDAELRDQAIDRTITLLDRLLDAAIADGRAGSAIEILVLRATALHAAGDNAAAITALELALQRAEPEGHIRLFLHAGPAVTALLRSVASRPSASEHARRVLAAIDDITVESPAAPGSRPSLIEPLSSRELDVLRLLRTDLSGPDIARELHISINTLRTHTKNIFTKLDASNRREAIRRAAHLGI
jgi:LuxR family maltose regulon positive regulatory protein